MTASAPSPMLDSGSRAWALVVAGLALLPLLLQLPGALATGLALTALATGALAWRKPLPAALRFVLALAMLAAVFWSMGGMRLGRDTGCALLAAMLAIKPAETASLRDARSLAGFALFAPFAAFLLDQGPLSMALGLLAALASLRVLQRLTDAETGTHPRRLGQDMAGIARLVGVGLPLALVTFWLFPRLATPLWGIPERALARPGLSERMTPGEWVDLMNDDSPALRAQFFGGEPTPQELYWRGPTLWDYDGREWRRNDWAGETPPAIEAETGKTWDYQIEYEATDRRLLVALDLATAAPAGARLTADHALVSERPLTALTRWRLQSTPPAVYQSELPPSLRQRATSLPPGYNPRTLALAAQWRAESSDDGAIVDRALTWIRSEFAYTLDTPLPGRDAVDEFLFTHKRGFCEHFSSAFVVLMRAAGIPARVVTGYTGGYRNPLGNYWVVRRQDAHAWAEVWLPRSGWTRVDPTAAVAPERIYDTLADRGNIGNALAGGDGEGTRRIRMVDISDWLRRGWNDLVLGFNAQRQQALLKPLGLDGIGERGLGLLFAACALLALLGMAWLMAHGQHERDPLLRAWHALGRRYAGFGLARLPHEPALAWAQRVADHHPQAGAALLPLSQRFVNARYASGDNEDKALPGDLRRHRPKDFHSRRLP